MITFEAQLVTAHLTQGLTCLEFGLVDFLFLPLVFKCEGDLSPCMGCREKKSVKGW